MNDDPASPGSARQLPITPRDEEFEKLGRTVRRIYETTAREASVREKEQEVRLAEIASNEKIALASIDAHAQAEGAKNAHEQHSTRQQNGFLLILVLLIMVFCAFLHLTGSKDLVMEVLKAFLAFGAGATGGYWAGKSRRGDDN